MSEKQIFVCAGKRFKDIYDLIKTMQETHKFFNDFAKSSNVKGNPEEGK